ncbi:restriction endonuclease subunit S, partial [Mycoplasmopsis pullorum]
CFYQPYEFTVVQDSYAIKLKNSNISLDKIKYFIITCLNRVISQFNWSNKSSWNKLRNNKIALPVKQNKIDYKFMEDFSAELEAQKIAELEAYIKVTGITNFDLNNEEQDMLDNINNLHYGEFLVSDLFSIETLVGLNKDKITVGNEYDYITRTSKNQGILLSTSFINGPQALNNANTWSLGLLQLNFFFRNKPWYGGQFIRKITPKFSVNREKQLYFSVLLNNLSSKLSSLIIREIDSEFLNSKMKLPINQLGEIDFDMIEKISIAFEKLIIAKIYHLANKKIEIIKNIIK